LGPSTIKRGAPLGHVERAICLILILLFAASAARAEDGAPQPAISEEPFGIALEGFPYPYPVMRFNDLVLRFLGDGH